MNRAYLERAIIGATILEGKYGVVKTIIKPKNFDNIQHKKLWHTIHSLWPYKPTDMLTVNRHYTKQHQGSASYLIAHCTANVSSSASLVHWAFLLLEMDIMEKFKAIIYKATSTYSKDIDKSGHLKEIMNHLEGHKADVFNLLPGVYKYLNNYELSHVADELEEFNEYLESGIGYIKNEDEIERLEQQLAQLKIDQKELEKAFNQFQTTKQAAA